MPCRAREQQVIMRRLACSLLRGQHLVAVIDLAVENGHLAGSAEPFLAVAGHVDPHAAQGLQHGLVGGDGNVQRGVAQHHLEGMLLAGDQGRAIRREMLHMHTIRGIPGACCQGIE